MVAVAVQPRRGDQGSEAVDELAGDAHARVERKHAVLPGRH